MPQVARVRARQATRIQSSTNIQPSTMDHLAQKLAFATYRRNSRLLAAMTSILAHASELKLWTIWEKLRASRRSAGQGPSLRFRGHKCLSMQISRAASFPERIQAIRSTKVLEVNPRSCLWAYMRILVQLQLSLASRSSCMVEIWKV